MDTLNDNQLVDEAIEAYVEWREECAAVWDAYRRWAQAFDADAELAFASYRAALVREEHASRVYAFRMEQITPPSYGVAEVLGATFHALR